MHYPVSVAIMGILQGIGTLCVGILITIGFIILAGKVWEWLEKP